MCGGTGHQPQHFQTSKTLRLVFDTAALRKRFVEVAITAGRALKSMIYFEAVFTGFDFGAGEKCQWPC